MDVLPSVDVKHREDTKLLSDGSCRELGAGDCWISLNVMLEEQLNTLCEPGQCNFASYALARTRTRYQIGQWCGLLGLWYAQSYVEVRSRTNCQLMAACI